jgi:hypothetical protein
LERISAGKTARCVVNALLIVNARGFFKFRLNIFDGMKSRRAAKKKVGKSRGVKKKVGKKRVVKKKLMKKAKEKKKKTARKKTARKTAGKSSRSDRFKRIESRLKKVDRELLKIEKALTEDTDSSVVDEDLTEAEEFWRMKTGLVRRGARAEKKFYKHFILRCRKCMSEFQHKADVGPVVRRLKCPGCDEEHEITITPSSRFFKIKFPESVEVVDSEE